LWDDPEVMSRLEELGIDINSAGAGNNDGTVDSMANNAMPDDKVDEGIKDAVNKFGSNVLDKLKKNAGVPSDPKVLAKQLARDNPSDPAGNFIKGGKQLGIFKEQEVEEGILDTLKTAGKKVVDFVAPDDEDLLNKLRTDAGLPPRMAIPNKPKPQDVGEDLDTDGVMMTKPSNMSS
jgi:hypothetical protein